MGRLSATAAPFVPSFASPPPTSEHEQAQQQQEDQEEQQWHQEEEQWPHQWHQQQQWYQDPGYHPMHADPAWEDDWVGGGYYDEWGNWVDNCPPATGSHAAQGCASFFHPDGVIYYQQGDQQTVFQHMHPVAAAAAAEDQEDDNCNGEQDQLATYSDITMSTADAVELLTGWYPSQPKPVIEQVFEACDQQLREASNILSDMEWEQHLLRRRRVASASTSGTISSSNGGPRAAVRQQQQEFQLQEEAFPGLPAASSDAGKQQQQQGSNGCSAVAAANKAEGVWNGPASKGGSSNSTGAAAGSSWAQVASKAAAAATVAGDQGPCAAADSPALPSLGGPGSGPPPPAAAAQSKPGAAAAAGDDASAAVPWVQTGAAVSRAYEAARAEARDHARVRNACFHQATQAYLAGNKGLAKELSAKGKQSAQLMWAAHDRASQQIFSQRNAHLAAATTGAGGGSTGISSRAGSNVVVDLHGLHVREVLAVLPQQLQQLAAQRGCSSVNIIVGTGHHTKGPPTARLGPAVEQLLQGLGYKYRQPQPGLLRVQLA